MAAGYMPAIVLVFALAKRRRANIAVFAPTKRNPPGPPALGGAVHLAFREQYETSQTPLLAGRTRRVQRVGANLEFRIPLPVRNLRRDVNRRKPAAVLVVFGEPLPLFARRYSRALVARRHSSGGRRGRGRDVVRRNGRDARRARRGTGSIRSSRPPVVRLR